MNLKQVMKGMIPVVGVLSMTIAASAQASDGAGVYNKVCKMCHGTGIGGAPKIGAQDQWADRIAQGNDTLYEHAIKGFKNKGFMPPKGGRAKLTDDEVKAAVDHMVAAAK